MKDKINVISICIMVYIFCSFCWYYVIFFIFYLYSMKKQLEGVINEFIFRVMNNGFFRERQYSF